MPPENTNQVIEKSEINTRNSNNLQLVSVFLAISVICNVLLVVLYNSEKSNIKPVAELPKVEIVEEDVFYDEVNDDYQQEFQEEPLSFSELSPDLTDYSMYYKELVKQDSVEWFPSPVLISNQDLITAGDSSLAYYQIGTRNNEPVVFVQVPCYDMMCNSYMIFVIHGNGTATFISKNSSVDLKSEYPGNKLHSNVITDNNYVFLALSPKKEITISGGVNIKMRGYGDTMGFYSETDFNQTNNSSLVEFVMETSFGPLFRAYIPDETAGTVDYIYAIRLPGGLHVAYDETQLGFVSDDRVPQITWLDGSINTQSYRGDRLTGCGGGGPEMLLSPISEQKIELVGTTKTGEKVYNLIDPSHPLITRIFEMTSGIVYEYDSRTGVSTNKTITPAEFVANRGVLIIESLGRQLVFTNTKFGPQVECGKPVIYLYPKATTTVTVNVDALVTKSEPVYGENGWVATAYPDGKLIVDGKPYNSLFWDGYGNGVYPELEKGYVVPTSEVLTVMSEHLRYIGFNEFEISEFVAFWGSHLPAEPYTRFSWLQTEEMERLAKLTITPRPDTLIRAFVDYEGVTEMIEIEPQKLFKRARNGYVATEWGGLLRK